MFDFLKTAVIQVAVDQPEDFTVLQQYREHVAERAAQGIPPLPLNAQQVASLTELLKAKKPFWLIYLKIASHQA